MCCVAADRPKTWPEAARCLGAHERTVAEHRSRWEEALTKGPPGNSVDDALDAAAGLSLLVDRFQRSSFGSQWTERLKAYRLLCRSLALEVQAPPVATAAEWQAMKAVMESECETWEEVEESLPDAFAVLRTVQRREPERYQRLADVAIERGQAIDVGARPRVLQVRRDLDLSAVFRRVWADTFGERSGIRPQAPAHVATARLRAAGVDSRATGLFLVHLGFTQTATVVGDGAAREDALLRLDNEVHNGLKVCRRHAVERTLLPTLSWLARAERAG